MRITQQLIRQKTEHHDGILDELEEIALHQLEIEKIENIDKCCRHLKILLLQNNLIEKIENMRKMKELEYLNLALNNISRIENLEGCECLRKLDLTVNFVDLKNLEESLSNLQENEKLRDLYLMGNPCTEWPNFRLFAVAHLPQLTQLDGKVITPTERIEARRELPRLKRELAEKIEEERSKPPVTSKTAYTIENRKKMYLEMAKDREEKEAGKNKQKGKEQREPPSVYNEKGEIRQCNQGRYDFVLDQASEPDKIILEIKTPKYLCSTAIDVDLHPNYVRCLIKDKLTQLRLPAEISVEESQVKHSRVTGHLRIEMPLLDPPVKREKRQPLELRKRQSKDTRSSALVNTTRTPPLLDRLSSSGTVDGSPRKDNLALREVSRRVGSTMKHYSAEQMDKPQAAVRKAQRSKTQHNNEAIKNEGSSEGDRATRIPASPFGTTSTAPDVDDDLPPLETVF